MADQSEFPETLDGADTLKLLDAAVRCGICYSIFDTPLALRSCGHSFCSSCIRQNIHYQERTGNPQCPSCRSPCDARDLLPNVALREISDRFTAARPVILHLIKESLAAKETVVAAAAAAAEKEKQLQQQEQASNEKKKKKESNRKPVRAEPQETTLLRRSARRSALGQATATTAVEAVKKEEEAAIASPGPRTRSSRRSKTKASTPPPQAAAAAVKAGGVVEKSPQAFIEEEDGKDEKKVDDEVLIEEEEEGNEEENEVSKQESEEEFIIADEDEEEDDEFDELSPSPPPAKKPRNSNNNPSAGQHRPPPPPQQQQQQQQQGGGVAVNASAGKSSTPQGFVACPICAKAVPSFYINSHVDQCLHAGGSGSGSGGGGSGSAPQQPPPLAEDKPSKAFNAALPVLVAPAPAPVQPASIALKLEPPGPFIPLAAPPRIVPTLSTEKSIRVALKKYGLSSDGKKPELLERYNQFRLSVATANDRQERTTYARLAQLIAAQERQRAAAALLGGNTGTGKTLLGVGVARAVVGGAAAGGAATAGVGNEIDVENGGNGDAFGISLRNSSFKELIRVTKARDAARKAAREAAAAAAEPLVNNDVNDKQQQSGQQQGDNDQNRVDSDLQQRPNTTLNTLNTDNESIDRGDDITAGEANNDMSKEAIVAEELRQAEEIALLDDSDDDNW